jgi:hypothetical protein
MPKQKEEKITRVPIYKRVKIQAPHCPKCGERLCQDNSLASPWECSCGIWEYTPIAGRLGEYEITKPKK